MVNAPRAQTALGNLKTAPFAQQHVFVGHPHVIEQHFGMPVGRIVVSEYRQWPYDFHPRRVDGHQDHRMLLMARVPGIAQTHEDQDFATRVTGTRGPPFAAVDHPLVAVANSPGVHIGRIGRSNIGLGHGKR